MGSGNISEEIIKRGLDAEEAAEEAEVIKMELAALSIREFGYNLQQFYNRFHSKVEQAEAMGCELEEHILSMFFQNGCLPHRNLKHMTQDENRRRGKTYEELYQDYQHAWKRVEMASGGRPRGGKSLATKFKGKCTYCGKNGHHENLCWDKNPESRPEWMRNRNNNNNNNDGKRNVENSQ